MKVKLYDDDGHLLWMGTVERIEPEPISDRPFRITVVAVPAKPRDVTETVRTDSEPKA